MSQEAEAAFAEAFALHVTSCHTPWWHFRARRELKRQIREKIAIVARDAVTHVLAGT